MTPGSWFKYFLFPIWIPKNSGSVISTHANTRSNLTNMAVKSTTLFHSIKSNYHTVQLLTIWKIHMSELHYIRLHPKLTVDDHIWDAQRDDNRLMSRGLEATGGMCSFRPFRLWQSRIESLNLLLVLTYFPCCISLLNPKKLLGLHGIATWLEGDKRVHGVQSVQPLGILLAAWKWLKEQTVKWCHTLLRCHVSGISCNIMQVLGFPPLANLIPSPNPGPW